MGHRAFAELFEVVESDHEVHVAGADDGGEVAEGFAGVTLVLFFSGVMFNLDRIRISGDMW